MVVASAGEDKKISLWQKNGKTLGTVPVTGKNNSNDLNEVTNIYNITSAEGSLPLSILKDVNLCVCACVDDIISGMFVSH